MNLANDPVVVALLESFSTRLAARLLQRAPHKTAHEVVSLANCHGSDFADICMLVICLIFSQPSLVTCTEVLKYL